jgi:hypothetical protein
LLALASSIDPGFVRIAGLSAETEVQDESRVADAGFSDIVVD